MKTYTTTSSKLLSILAAIILGLNFVSCSSEEDEPVGDPSAPNVTEAQVTFTYTVPDELLRYAEITVVRNNNEDTDAEWGPMLNKKHTVTYNINKFPFTAPVVMVYDKTNRSGYGVDVDWDITMEVEVTMTIGGQKVTKTNFETYNISGDLGAGITNLQKNVLDRTYVVKLSKKGDVKFMH